MNYQIWVYLSIAFVLFVFFLLVVMVVYFLKLRKKWVYLSFAILYFIATIVLINRSIEPVPPSNETYEFKIGVYPDSDIFISDFNLFYDFKKQEGKIQFYAGGIGMTKLELLRIFLPSNSTVTSVVLFNDTDKDENKIFECINEDDKKDEEAICRIDSTDDVLEIDFWKQKSRFRIHTEFKGSLKPDSKFLFENDNRVMESRENGLLSFYLGDYECKENCLLSSGDRVMLNPIYSPTKPIIVVNRDSKGVENKYKLADREEFALNVENNKSKFLSNLYIALSTGFFIATFTLFVQFVVGLLYEEKNKEENSKKNKEGKAKTKRPVIFRTRSGKRVSFGARRQSQRRGKVSFLARSRR